MMAAPSSGATTDTSQQPAQELVAKPEVRARALLCADADISLRCKDGQDVCAHSMMLRLASPVWRDLLNSTTGCSTIPADEDSAEDMELLLCLLYPIMPKPALSLANVEQLARLAHKYDVQRVLGECDIYLQSLDFTTTAPSATMPKPWEAEAQHAMRWLQLGSDWGMPSVVDKSIEVLNGVLRKKPRICPSCGRDHPAAVCCSARYAAAGAVHGLQPVVCDDAFLSRLSNATLVKLVKAAATWSA